jgi:hypothetical protein
LDISSPQTSHSGTTGNIRTPPVAVAFLHCCSLNKRVDSYCPYQFSFDKGKKKTWYKPWVAIKSALKPMKTIAKITLKTILKFSLLFLI